MSESTSQTVTKILAFVAPTGLLTGIFYYFGYVSARSYYNYFGISLSALDLPASQYFIQTTDTAFRPLATLAIICLVALFAHQVIENASFSRGRGRGRTIVYALLLASAALTVVGLVGLYSGSGGAPSAISLALAVVLTEYAFWLAPRTKVFGARVTTLASSRTELRRGIFAAIFFVAIFWATTDLAHERGTERALLVERTLPVQGQAVVYSTEQLHIPGPGVEMTRLAGNGDGYGYRYLGLRPLIYAHDRWYLVPSGWTRDNGDTVVVLQDDPGQVRVDLAPGF